LVTYSNAAADKSRVLTENKKKSGMWKNLINGKLYIGSSEKLARRFGEYFNTNYLLKNNSMYICNSLLKHGYLNFSLTILEYCEPNKCLEREKHYWETKSRRSRKALSSNRSYWYLKGFDTL